MHSKRESGIETLKIVAVFMIVCSHVAKTLGTIPTNIVNVPQMAFFDTEIVSDSLFIMILQLLQYLGPLGNAIFLYHLHGFCVTANMYLFQR